MRTDQIALQLYTVRERTAADFVGTLRELAAIGYRAVEIAGYGKVPVRALRAALDELGLRATGAHMAYERFEAEFGQVVAELRALGAEFAIVPWLARERWGGGQGVRRLAARFNEWGERCRAEGLTFGYHNHAFEFEPLPGEGGRTMLDALLAETDPALVAFELDVYWAAYAGADPLGLLRRHAERIPLLHLKDMGVDPERSDVPVGAGTITWGPILEAAEAGVQWYIVEQDNPRDPLADVTASLRAVEAMATG
jgi:sugar phosphate isomerase/epimerase